MNHWKPNVIFNDLHRLIRLYLQNWKPNLCQYLIFYLQVPYRFRVAKGSLSTVPKELIFEPVFPGERAELKLKVFSSFAQDMITSDVMTVPHDARFTFKHEVKQGRSGIISGEKSTIGKVTFNPGATCRHDDSCYVGFRLPSRRKFVLNFCISLDFFFKK